MVKLVYTYALGAYAARRAGSSPVPGTTTLAPLWCLFYAQNSGQSIGFSYSDISHPHREVLEYGKRRAVIFRENPKPARYSQKAVQAQP